jgi:cholesterol oxidase
LALSNSVEEGVVDRLGRIFKRSPGNTATYYDGLYVADDSIIPSPLGINPSLTISALSFRIAEEIAGDKKYWPL